MAMCSYPEELQQVLEKIRKADGVILGSPIYNGTDTAVMRAFVERLSYPFLFRDCPYQKPFATIYDLGMDDLGYNSGHNATSSRLFKRTFGSFETMTAYGTYQYDYDKYDGFRTNEERKPISEK
ncbi:MAG: flavodoxin family protein [Clostridia bacterium]|nr:flavodoxin family protein [Clostridia bacterium]